MVAADYLRASLYNSSSSNPVSFMVNGGLSTSKLTFRMPLNEHALTGSFEYTGSDKNPTATLVSGKEFLSVTRMSRSFTVTVNPSSALTPGIHTASIDVEAAGAKAGTLQVVVFVDGQLSTTTPKVTLISNDQSAPAGTSFPVNFDGGSLVVTSPDAPWLSAQISNGSQAVRGKYVAHVQVTASAIGMSAGRHIGTLVISQPGSSAAPASVAVELDEYFSGRYQAKTVVSNLPGMKFVCDHTVYTAPYRSSTLPTPCTGAWE